MMIIWVTWIIFLHFMNWESRSLTQMDSNWVTWLIRSENLIRIKAESGAQGPSPGLTKFYHQPATTLPCGQMCQNVEGQVAWSRIVSYNAGSRNPFFNFFGHVCTGSFKKIPACLNFPALFLSSDLQPANAQPISPDGTSVTQLSLNFFARPCMKERAWKNFWTKWAEWTANASGTKSLLSRIRVLMRWEDRVKHTTCHTREYPFPKRVLAMAS